jgi:hyperosmotically inducible protein
MKRILATSIISLGLLGSLQGCLPLVLGAGAAGGYYVGEDERPVEVITRDAGITASVKARLIREKDLSAFSIDVDTYEGIVTLIGTVSNQNTADRAVKIARKTEGVTEVISKLTVHSGTVEEDAVERSAVNLPDELPEEKTNGATSNDDGKAYPID